MVNILYRPEFQEVAALLVQRTPMARTFVADHLIASRYNPPETWLRKQLI